MKNDLGIYIHIPFCAQKCAYCDFISQPGDAALYSAYAEALKTELLSYEPIWSSRKIATLYVGGGTPSVFPVALLKDVLEPLIQKSEDDTEVTLEVNPESVDAIKAQQWKQLGVNRISMGVQSTDPTMLLQLGRLHSRARIFESYQILQSHFDNINLDLLYALGDKDETYLSSLEDLIALKPVHLSTYELEIYPHLPLASKLSRAGDKSSYQQFHHLRNKLESCGYERYEVSNFARAGFVSKHNLRYWNREDTLGIGLAAHGLLGKERTSNTEYLDKYLTDPLCGQRERLTEDEEAFETWMLGLRKTTGVDLVDFTSRYPKYPVDKAVTKHIERGNLIQEGHFVHPSTQGFDLLNQVILDFMK